MVHMYAPVPSPPPPPTAWPSPPEQAKTEVRERWRGSSDLLPRPRRQDETLCSMRAVIKMYKERNQFGVFVNELQTFGRSECRGTLHFLCAARFSR